MTTVTQAGRAARLRQATSAQHEDAETRSFVTRLMGGDLDLDAYVAYLAQLAYVYRALESRVPRAGDPSFVNDPALPRFASIVADLEALGADDWEVTHPPLPSTTDYTDRITAVSDQLPRHIAHHYTRYLGDLSGGQSIAKRVADHYGATPDQLSFYRFDAIDRPGPFKVAYRKGIDSLDFGIDQEAAMIDEAQRAFDHNAAIFESLADTVA